jgi:hypothetical protein
VYRRSKFLEVLIEVRQEMAREADFDTDLFAEMIRSGHRPEGHSTYSIVERSEKDTPPQVPTKPSSKR